MASRARATASAKVRADGPGVEGFGVQGLGLFRVQGFPGLVVLPGQ